MSDATQSSTRRLNIDEPRWDQRTFIGRLKHFFTITDPRNCLASRSELLDAKDLLEKYRRGKEPLQTTDEDVWRAKKLYESAFHPDTGQLQNVIGRMSFQVPGGMAITGCLLQFYKTNTAVILWQWVNQSFNALVNYTNRNAQSGISNKQITIAYVSATSAALVAALGFKRILAKRSSNLLQRFVPFAAVGIANMVNIPLMRQQELINGISCFDEDGNVITESRYAAVKGISQVIFSRITMAAPGMLLVPVIMEHVEKYRWMQKFQRFGVVTQIVLVGCFLMFMTPTACSLFPQKCSMTTSKLHLLDRDKKKELERNFGSQLPGVLYFNKGL